MTKLKITTSDGTTTFEVEADALKEVIRNAILEALLAKEFMDGRKALAYRREKGASDHPAFDYASGVAQGIEWGRKVLESAAGQD